MQQFAAKEYRAALQESLNDPGRPCAQRESVRHILRVHRELLERIVLLVLHRASGLNSDRCNPTAIERGEPIWQTKSIDQYQFQVRVKPLQPALLVHRSLIFFRQQV